MSETKELTIEETEYVLDEAVVRKNRANGWQMLPYSLPSEWVILCAADTTDMRIAKFDYPIAAVDMDVEASADGLFEWMEENEVWYRSFAPFDPNTCPLFSALVVKESQ